MKIVKTPLARHRMRGRVRARLLVYILGAVSGDLGSTLLTRTYEIGEWIAFGNRMITDRRL